jgi:hypothetical protein
MADTHNPGYPEEQKSMTVSEMPDFPVTCDACAERKYCRVVGDAHICNACWEADGYGDDRPQALIDLMAWLGEQP